MAGRALLIPMVLGVFLMGGALGFGYVQDASKGEALASSSTLTNGQPLGASTNALTHTQTPVQQMAPPSLAKEKDDGSFVATIVAMFKSEPIDVEEEAAPIPTKTICSKKQGFKSCKIVPDTES